MAIEARLDKAACTAPRGFRFTPDAPVPSATPGCGGHPPPVRTARFASDPITSPEHVAKPSQFNVTKTSIMPETLCGKLLIQKLNAV
jgi:hypothetical protein